MFDADNVSASLSERRDRFALCQRALHNIIGLSEKRLKAGFFA
jgi:hypothetical protein